MCAFKVWHFLVTLASVAVFLLTVVLLGVSVNQAVAQDEYGVVYHNFTKAFGPTYVQGTYALDVGEKLFKFKRTLQDVKVSQVDCISKDGLKLTLHVAAQYQYIPDALIPIVLKSFDTDANYNSFLGNIVTNIVLRQCGLFTTQQYYTARGLVFGSMYDALVNEINNSTDFAATIEFFQLLNIAFPDDYQSVITEKQHLVQTETTTLNIRTTQLIDANTTLLQNRIQANVILINAANQVAIITNQANASYGVVLSQWRQRLSTLRAIVDNLKLNHTQLLDYLSSELVRQSTGAVLGL